MIPVHPYKRNPEPPTVALMTVDGVAVDERGRRLDFDDWPADVRCWVSYDDVRELVAGGQGEALCWNDEEVRWRHRRFEEGWKRRPSDVHVLRLPFGDDPRSNLRALQRWRDWLGRYGAAPTSTTGGAAWSLLRARLEETVWLSMGTPPPLLQTLGGRQENGPAGPGRFDGRLVQYDLPAAYASELGGLKYGGSWHRTSDLTVDRDPEWWARDGRPVFCRARVTVPELEVGPLPRRPRARMYGLRATLFGATYPTGARLQGVWTWQEIAAAEQAGCRVEKIVETWIHVAGERRPFAPWWEAIEDGRRMPGLAGLLAKTTGNALWGNFCMDAHNNGARSIRGRERGKLETRAHPFRGGRPPAHDLAETVSGRVRARLFDLMAAAGDRLVTAHTDGAWVVDELELDDLHDPSGWRPKQAATRLDLIGPQVLRYWPRGRVGPEVVFSGMTTNEAGPAFEAAWLRLLDEQAAAA